MQRSAVRIIFLLSMACSFPIRADIIVSIGSTADRDVLFWVETKSNHPFIHSSYITHIDERFVRPGETATIPVMALNPITFSHVYAVIYHPAYVYESKQVKEMPSVFKTVRIPKFEPRSWREFIDSGEKVLHSGHGIHLVNVIDHLRLFIEPYLPAIDNAGIKNNLKDYIPLFEELISYTKKTLPQSTYGSKSTEELRKKDPVYAQRLDRTEQRRLKELNDVFIEIKALLSLSTEERIRLRAMQARLINTRSVHQELMTAQDRQRIEEFLDFQFEHSRAHPKPEKAQQWTSSDTSVLYSIILGHRYALNGKGGKRLYDNCYRTNLRVDLNGGVETDLNNIQKGFGANFCRNDKGEWVIQLPGRK